jgi:hypothetical protein
LSSYFTTDKNLAYQQNLVGRRIAVVVLGNSRWPIVERYLDKVGAAVDAARPGAFANKRVRRVCGDNSPIELRQQA